MYGSAARAGCVAGLVVGLSALAGCDPLIQEFRDQLGLPINVAAGLQAETVVAEAAHPTGLAFAPDGRVFYSEKDTGRIRVMVDGKLLDAPFAEVPVNIAGDRGLLGIAVHPSFNANSRIYVFYTRSLTGQVTSDPNAVADNRVVYFVATGDVASEGEVFVAAIPAEGAGQRVGGRIGFASDGALFVAVGDQGSLVAAQNTSRLSGKILRYNDDGTIPAGNPIANSAVYARGLRDPQGLTFDPVSKLCFVTDQNLVWDHEIDRIEAGKDYGWPAVIGVADTPDELAYAAATPEYVDPLFTSGADFSPLVGVGFNPSTKYGLDRVLNLFYGVSDTQHIRRLVLADGRDGVAGEHGFAVGLPALITDMAFTSAGTLYVACQNAILRVVTFP